MTEQEYAYMRLVSSLATRLDEALERWRQEEEVTAEHPAALGGVAEFAAGALVDAQQRLPAHEQMGYRDAWLLLLKSIAVSRLEGPDAH